MPVTLGAWTLLHRREHGVAASALGRIRLNTPGAAGEGGWAIPHSLGDRLRPPTSTLQPLCQERLLTDSAKSRTDPPGFGLTIP